MKNYESLSITNKSQLKKQTTKKKESKYASLNNSHNNSHKNYIYILHYNFYKYTCSDRLIFASSGTHAMNNIRDFKIQRRGQQRKCKKKTIGLISTTTTSHVHHAFLYISFPFLHDYDVKMPNFAFYGGRKQAKTKFYFSF